MERILSFRETCRLRAEATFPLLVDLIRNHFTGTEPDLAGSENPGRLPYP